MKNVMIFPPVDMKEYEQHHVRQTELTPKAIPGRYPWESPEETQRRLEQWEILLEHMAAGENPTKLILSGICTRKELASALADPQFCEVMEQISAGLSTSLTTRAVLHVHEQFDLPDGEPGGMMTPKTFMAMQVIKAFSKHDLHRRKRVEMVSQREGRDASKERIEAAARAANEGVRAAALHAANSTLDPVDASETP